MFNGIIKITGKINKIFKSKNNCTLEILSGLKLSKNEIGTSISCSGVCLTLVKYKKNLSTFYISKETLNKTNFSYAKKGDIINIEKSMKFGNRISGHFVYGHIDTIFKVLKIKKLNSSWNYYPF